MKPHPYLMERSLVWLFGKKLMTLKMSMFNGMMFLARTRNQC